MGRQVCKDGGICKGLGVGVQQELVLVKAVAIFGVKGSIYSIQVKGSRLKSLKAYVPNVACSICIGI